jgi:activator of 2-hydroxyglutaryl-CoA dehydratase
MVGEFLQIDLDEMVGFFDKSSESVEVTSFCAVFAESEIISLINMGKRIEDIVSGVLRGFAQRILTLLINVNYEKEVIATGGVAKNIGVIKAISELLHLNVLVPNCPDMVNAVGAAIVAQKGVAGK